MEEPMCQFYISAPGRVAEPGSEGVSDLHAIIKPPACNLYLYKHANKQENRGGAKIAYVAIRSLHKFM